MCFLIFIGIKGFELDRRKFDFNNQFDLNQSNNSIKYKSVQWLKMFFFFFKKINLNQIDLTKLF